MRLVNVRIKKIRKNLGLSQLKFAERLRISRGHVSKIENDPDSISKALIKLISLEFGVNEEWLLTGKGEPFTAKPVELPEEQKIQEKKEDKTTIWDECMGGCPWRVKSYSSSMVDEDGNMAHLCKGSGMKCEAVACAPYVMFGFKGVEGAKDGDL